MRLQSSQIFIVMLLILLGCREKDEIDPCLSALELISQDINERGNKIFKVQGELRTFSKNMYELEHALSQSMQLPDGTFVGTVVFEENFADCFGYFLIDSRKCQNFSKIPLHSRVLVTLEQIALDPKVSFGTPRYKRLKYLYIVEGVEKVDE